MSTRSGGEEASAAADTGADTLNGALVHVPALERGIAILELLASRGEPVSFAALRRQLEIPKASLFRLLRVLETACLVRQAAGNGAYHLGTRLLWLGAAAAQSLSLVEFGRPALERLVGATEETAELWVREGDELVCLDRRESPHSLRLVAQPGKRFNRFHHWAQGKVFLAYADPAFLQRYLERVGLAARTERTITDQNLLMRDLAATRARGYAVDVEEARRGVTRVAAPVYDAAMGIACVLSVAGPSQRLTECDISDTAKLLVDVARQLSSELGARL